MHPTVAVYHARNFFRKDHLTIEVVEFFQISTIVRFSTFNFEIRDNDYRINLLNLLMYVIEVLLVLG